MAKNNDSFDFDKYKSKEKKEKPIKEKKEKNISFDMGDSDSFDTDKFHKKEKKEKSPIFKSKDTFLDEKENPKKLKAIVIVAVAVVLAIILIATLVVVLTQQNQFDDQIDRISIETYPEDTSYYVGEDIDKTGLTIRVTMISGKSYIVDGSECEISGFDSSKAVENQKVTVNYQEHSCTFNVEIKEVPKPTPVLTSIYLDPLPKTEYKLGERLNTDGGVLVLCYSDGSEYRVTLLNSYVYGFSEVTTADTYTLTVKYAENGVLVTTTYDITVTE